jgi:hypothetical protein
VKVLYNHEHSSSVWLFEDESGKSLEQTPLFLFRLQRGWKRKSWQKHRQFWNQSGQLGRYDLRMGCERLRRQLSQVRPQQVNEWGVGKSRVWLEALALEAQDLEFIRTRTGRRDKPRLANAGFASDQDGLPAASPNLLKRPLQRCDLIIAADDDGADDRFVN